MQKETLYQNFTALKEKLEIELQYSFKNDALLKEALTHRSISLLHPQLPNYERLEFLGDAVLDMIAAQHLYQDVRQHNEGELTQRRSQYVSEEALFAQTGALLKDLIVVAKGLRQEFDKTPQQKAERSIISDVCEALIAVIYLESGIDICTTVVKKWLGDIPQFQQEKPHPKGLLQEFLQKKLATLSRYESTRIGGSDHMPEFKTTVWVHKQKIASEISSSQKKSATKAAAKALSILESYSLDELNLHLKK